MSPAGALTFAAVAGFGLLHWMALLQPAEPLRAAAALAIALLVTVRPLLLLVPAIAAALIAGGVHPDDLWPGHWDELGATIDAGLESVASVQLPYRGSDTAVGVVLGTGGALLVLGAALVAVRSRAAGLVVLGCLYAIPSIAVGFDDQFARGAVFALLVLAYVCFERLRARDLAPAVGVAITAAVLALVAAPALDGDRPWLDYEALAEGGDGLGSTSFKWEHDYAGLVWPREGREMLVVASPRRTYWKAETLDRFERGHWQRDPLGGTPLGGENVGVDPANLERWSFDIDVSIRGLRSNTMPVAAVAESVTMPGLTPNLEAAGIWHAGRDLERGDSYSARVYVPDPSGAQLAAATGRYPDPILESLTFELPRTGRDNLGITIRGFKEGPLSPYFDTAYATAEIRASEVGRIWDLSRRLLAEADTPYEYLQAVQRQLQRGYLYDETPPPESSTLDGFLFETKIGFCQHFSGAMALLLRMGGVPARVATGFAPGAYDDDAERYVVRDVDAHSWVEAWFKGIGWVVFDPTPAAAPPRSQALPGAITAGVGDSRDAGTSQTLSDPVGEEPGRGPVIVLLGILVLAAVAGGWSRRPGRFVGTELERALRAAGHPVAPGVTLTGLAARLDPGAGGYLGSLRKERYAGGEGPTAPDRRALRRALAAGRGPLVRARVWRALNSSRKRRYDDK